MADDLGTLADELYALPADDFVAARDARAKQLRSADGDRDLAREVAALPKPTVAAWLLNQLARRRTTAVEQLVDLGAEMREAQQSLDGEQLRVLTRQRQQVVRAFSRQVAELGEELGRPVSGAVADQVEETLRAAVADEEAGQALLSGRLTTALSYIGMGQGSVSEAVAVPRARAGAPRRSSRPADEPDDEVAAARERHRQAARDALEQAERQAEQATRTVARLDDELARLAGRRSTVRDRQETVRAELAALEADLAGVETQQQRAQGERDAADETARTAREDADRARHEIDDARGRDER